MFLILGETFGRPIVNQHVQFDRRLFVGAGMQSTIRGLDMLQCPDTIWLVRKILFAGIELKPKNARASRYKDNMIQNWTEATKNLCIYFKTHLRWM